MALYRSVLSSKGQLVIPSELRKQLGMRPGTGVSLEVEGDRIVMVPDSSLNWRNMTGWLKGKPTALDILEHQRKADKDDE
jgi:AbrB family looped-hinge helix DNA binding protein